MDQRVQTFLATLWRGGAWGYYWRPFEEHSRSQWTPTCPLADCTLGTSNVYIGVHPTHEARASNQRARIPDLATVNCLYSEFDAKDERFGGDVAQIREHIKRFPIQPQVVIFSGGGLHAYWFTRETTGIYGGNDEYLRGIQSAWVRLTGGDTGAKDLARVLRLPGTFNAKYDPPRAVTFARFNLTPEGTELYEMNDLCALAEPMFDAPAILPATDRPAPTTFAGANIAGIVNTLAAANEGTRNGKLLWCACRLIEHGLNESAIIEELLPVALRIGLAERESLATIKSAGKQPQRNTAPLNSRPDPRAMRDVNTARDSIRRKYNA